VLWFVKVETEEQQREMLHIRHYKKSTNVTPIKKESEQNRTHIKGNLTKKIIKCFLLNLQSKAKQ
jgi:hypothetical protein